MTKLLISTYSLLLRSRRASELEMQLEVEMRTMRYAKIYKRQTKLMRIACGQDVISRSMYTWKADLSLRYCTCIRPWNCISDRVHIENESERDCMYVCMYIYMAVSLERNSLIYKIRINNLTIFKLELINNNNNNN